MKSGEWRVGSGGKWGMGNGEWEMSNEEWVLGNGEWGVGSKGNSVSQAVYCRLKMKTS